MNDAMPEFPRQRVESPERIMPAVVGLDCLDRVDVLGRQFFQPVVSPVERGAVIDREVGRDLLDTLVVRGGRIG
jgi:hypothetical protein